MGWLNPLHGTAYQFWSGIGSDVFLHAPFLFLWRHLNCHQEGCWRIGHPHPDTEHRPVCRKHHPHS